MTGEQQEQDRVMLQYIVKTADMGTEGIVSVMGYVEDDKLKEVLQRQLSEYKVLKQEGKKHLVELGEEPEGANTMSKVSAEVMSMGKLLLDRSASKIAEMTIQGTSMGVSRTIQHLNDYTGHGPVKALALRLLATEETGIEELKPFL